MDGPRPKRRKFRSSERYRGDWGPDAIEEWNAVFDAEEGLEYRPIKSQLSGWEILQGMLRFLRDPEGLCAAPRLVGGQCRVAAGEATANELCKSFGKSASDGAVRLILFHAAGLSANTWLAHPLRTRLWQPTGPGKPWLLVRLATKEESDQEHDDLTAYRAEYATWVAAMDAEPDPAIEPDRDDPSADRLPWIHW